MSGKLLSALMPALCRSRDKSPRIGVIQQDKHHSLGCPQRLCPLKPALRNADISYKNVPLVLKGPAQSWQVWALIPWLSPAGIHRWAVSKLISPVICLIQQAFLLHPSRNELQPKPGCQEGAYFVANSSRSTTIKHFIWDGLLGNQKTSGKLSFPHGNMMLVENYQLALLLHGVKDT